MFAGCVQESIDSFESIKLDKTYLTIPEAGGEVELTITATQDWNFVETEMWPRVIAYKKDSNGKEIKDAEGNKVIDEEKTTPSWLTLQGEMTGTAGETKVVFSADPTNGGRELELSIKAGNNVQYFRVRQGTMVASDATCAEVIAGVDGKSYRVQGVCTSIANTSYGNFYLNDGTGEIYIYGTKDGDGQYNWKEFNIEVGDSVKVEGPRKDFNGTIELVDALFIKVIKSLIKLVKPTDKMVDREGETFDVKLAYKGKGVFYTVADECSSWVKIEGMTSKSGEPTKLEPNPADTAIVTVTVAPFEELSSRAGSIEFSSSLDGAKSVITFAFRQGVEAKTAAEFNAMEKGSVPYKVTGCVREITNTQYGNMYVADHTGSVYVYGTLDADGNSKNFASLGIEVGDIVSVVSPVDVFKDAAQMKNATVAEKIDVEAKTVEAFLATEEDKTYYRLTGTVSGIADGDIYGNMTITDETGSVYVYGLLSGYGGEKKLFQDLVADTNLSNGDKLTLVGYHTSHKGNPQVGGAFYLLHEEGSEGGEGGEEPETPAEPKVVTVAEFLAAAEDATVYKLTGTITEFYRAYNPDYNNVSFYLQDETDKALIFNMSCENVEDPTSITIGDEITVLGTRGAYNGNPQMTNSQYVSHVDKTTEPEEPAEPEFEAGKYWIVAGDNAAMPKSGDFGYLSFEPVWKSSSSVASVQTNAFTFEAVAGGFNIKDSNGKYLYAAIKEGTTYHNSFHLGANPTDAGVWTVKKNDDGTYTIKNTTSNSWIQCSMQYNSFGHYPTAQSNALMPTLVKVENAVPAVEIPKSLEIAGAGETKTITLPEGVTVTPTCDNEAFSVSAAANVVTISAESAAEAKSGTLTLALAYNGFSITKTIAISQKAATDTSVTEVISGTFTYDESAKALKLTTTSGITITQAIASGSTAVNKSYNTAQTLRVYKGHKLTFSGKIFKKIIFEHSSTYAGNSVTASGGTYTPGSTSSEWSGSEDNVVITNTGTAANVQLRPTKITVIY